MLSLFHSIVFQPIYNALVFFYEVVPGADFGIAIIITTLLLKLLMFPLSQKQIQSQKKMQEIQPKIKALQEKLKHNKEEQTKALLKLYKDEKANPFSGCLPLIVQIVVLIAIYRVIITISNSQFTVNPQDLYSFVSDPGVINHFFLHTVNLAEPSYVFAILSAFTQYFQTKMLLQHNKKPKETDTNQDKQKPQEPDFNTIMTQQMLYMGPLITLFIGFTFPAALSLYWFVSTLFMLVQQKLIFDSQKELSRV